MSVLILLGSGGCGKAPTATNEVPHPIPQRIISMAPSVTEILYGVGAFPRVIAVSRYCEFPPGVEKLPRIGSWIDSSLEKVLSLRPDLVVMSDAQASFSDSQLRKLGVRTLVVQSQSLEETYRAIETIGLAVGCERQGKELAAQTRAKIDGIREKTRGLARPRVLCVVDRMPGMLRDLYAAARGSFMSELLEVAGGESASAGAGDRYGKITKEAVVSLNPDIIIDMVQGATGRLREDPEAVWSELPTVRAVRERRVFPIRELSAIHPSQFVSDTALRFARIIHPEVFGRDESR